MSVGVSAGVGRDTSMCRATLLAGLCQSPVLALPYSRVSELPPVSSIALRPPHACLDEKKALWEPLANLVVQRFGHCAQRSADYRMKLCRDELSRDPLPPLPWHEHARQPAVSEEATAGLGNPVLVRDMWPAAQFIAHVRR